MRLTDRQRAELRAAAAFGVDYIDIVIEAIRLENPGAFINESNQEQRVFFDEPMQYGFVLPHFAFVHRWIPRHERIL